MIDFALHVEHGRARIFGNIVDVFIANLPVHVTNGEAIKVAAKDFADLDRRIAVRDLRCLAFDESRMTAELINAGFKRTTCRVLEKKNNIASTLSRR